MPALFYVSKIINVFDQFEKFDMKATPKNPKLVGLTTLIAALEVWKHKAKIKKTNMRGVKPPYILLANHNAFLDIHFADLES